MEYYTLVGGLVAVIGLLCLIIWLRTGSPALPLGFATFYYWSLHGAWGIIEDRTYGSSGQKYGYLEAVLFPIQLDDFYYRALLYYGLFIIATQIACLAVIRRRPSASVPSSPVMVSHGALLVLGMIGAAITFALMASSFAYAIETAQSVYAVARIATEGSGVFVLYQMAALLTLDCLFIGLAIWLSGPTPKLLGGPRRKWHLAAYAVLLAAVYVHSALSGSKGLLFAGAIAGFLFYCVNVRKIPMLRVGLLGVAAIYVIILVDVLRYYSPTQTVGAVEKLELDEVNESLVASNEAYGAHFSMYGVLRYNVEPTLGLGFEAAIATVIPKFLYSERPPGLYPYYIANTGGSTTQGFALHHATGWYLDFGLPGLFAGAILLGGFMGWLHNLSLRPSRRTLLGYCFSAVGLATFVSALPQLIRSPGVEAYKGMAIDGFILPLTAIMTGIMAHRLIVSVRSVKRIVRAPG